MKNKPPAGRELPPQFKNQLDIGFRRKFTWKERLQILCGYSADIALGVYTEHHPGRFTPFMKITITPELKPETQN